MDTTTTFAVEGMTCEHCVRAVTEELLALDSVRSAQVDLATGSASIVTDGETTQAELAAAVDEAGYRLVPS
jgi:copper chaperone CopZ